MPVFKTGALNHSATLPSLINQRLRIYLPREFRQHPRVWTKFWTISRARLTSLSPQPRLGLLVLRVADQLNLSLTRSRRIGPTTQGALAEPRGLPAFGPTAN